MLGRFMFEPCHMDEVEFHAPPRESKSKRWLSFHPFSGMAYIIDEFIYLQMFLTVFMPLNSLKKSLFTVSMDAGRQRPGRSRFPGEAGRLWVLQESKGRTERD